MLKHNVLNTDSSSVVVTGVGTAVVDYLGVVEHFPQADTQVELQTFSKQSGGNVATAMVTLARLGVNCGFQGKFGDDELGRFVQQRLHHEGIDLSGSLIEPGGSMGFAFIVVERDSGRRTIMWTNDGKAHLRDTELNRSQILGSRYLHLDHYSIDAAIAAAKIAKTGNVQVVLDAESLHPQINQLLPMVDVLIVCADFARKFTGHNNIQEALRVLKRDTCATTVAITDGENGNYSADASQSHYQRAFSINPVDTTGCGDVFHGAFIYGLLESWPLPKLAEFASAAAALNCRSLGGQAGIPTLAEVNTFIAKQG